MEMPGAHSAAGESTPTPESLVTELVDAGGPLGARSYGNSAPLPGGVITVDRADEGSDEGWADGDRADQDRLAENRVGPDWAVLRSAARDAASRAHCPYSGLGVGAAALVDDGRVVLGCNVENASYGVTLCAECALVGQLQLTGGGRLAAVACRSAAGELLVPCGRCRQVLHEMGGPELLVDMPRGPRPLSEVLPDAFSL